MSSIPASPFVQVPAAEAGEESFVDESLIRRMIGDGRLAVKSAVARERMLAERAQAEPQPVVLGSWL